MLGRTPSIEGPVGKGGIGMSDGRVKAPSAARNASFISSLLGGQPKQEAFRLQCSGCNHLLYVNTLESKECRK